MSSAVSCSSLSVLPDEEAKLAVVGEHTRHKRRRRGKKRKLLKSEKSVNESDISETNVDQISDAVENRELEKGANNTNKRRPRGILIRPIDVPKAPKNSTQFIIDDHKGCGLYYSFETPNPYYKGEFFGTRTDAVELYETAGDAAFQDIDYKYESPQDLDDSAYYTQDFEDAYSTSRYEELMLLSKKDLLETVANLETRLEELEEDLVKYDPSTVIEQLQQKLLSLQEENAILTGLNSSLKATFSVESNDSASEQSLEEELSENEEPECLAELEVSYPENVESTSEPSVDGNLPEDRSDAENAESTSDPSVDGNHLENEDICRSDAEDVESMSDRSVDGNLPENLDISGLGAENSVSQSERSRGGRFPAKDILGNIEPCVGPTVSSGVGELSEHSLEHRSSEKEKIEYNSMSEKLSNVEIAESVTEDVNL